MSEWIKCSDKLPPRKKVVKIRKVPQAWDKDRIVEEFLGKRCGFLEYFWSLYAEEWQHLSGLNAGRIHSEHEWKEEG